MAARAWGAEYRSTTVCIDSYEDGVPIGRFYNPYLPEGRNFKSVTQFLTEMEQALDTMDFPKAFQSTRSFAKPPPPTGKLTEALEQTGKAATFTVRVMFRQNASWQGSVIWQEGRQEQSFRSVLELIFLIDSAMCAAKAS